MKQIILCLILLVATGSVAQLENVNLTNAVIIGQLDKPEERYTLEINLATLLSDYGVSATPSLNHIKAGENAQVMASDSLTSVLKQKGFDTYILVSVRGYDRRFKASERQTTLVDRLGEGTLNEIYRSDAVSVSFEFTFYRNGQFIATDIVQCGNISDRDSVLKRFRKKVSKRIVKKWK